MPNLRTRISAAFSAGFTVGMPYQAVGAIGDGDPSSPLVVSVTEATLVADKALRARFWRGVWAIAGSLPQQSGLVGYALQRQILGNKVWTMSVWRSENDLMFFVRSELHRRIAQEGSAALAAMRTSRFRHYAAQGAPNWRIAVAQLARLGPY